MSKINGTLWLLCLAMSVLCSCADAQPNTDAKSWLSSAGSESPSSSAPPKSVAYTIVVKEARQDAISTLAATPILALSEERAKYYGGDALADIELNLRQSGASGVKPFLVRGVNPNSSGSCSIKLAGDVLDVGCFSLGDFAYEKRPYVVLLSDPPTRVFVLSQSAR